MKVVSLVLQKYLGLMILSVLLGIVILLASPPSPFGRAELPDRMGARGRNRSRRMRASYSVACLRMSFLYNYLYL